MRSVGIWKTKGLGKLINCLAGSAGCMRRGNVEQVLIMVVLISFLVLPLGLIFARQIQTWYLFRRAEQTIEQILPSAILCLNPDDLSEGRLRLSYAHVEIILNEQLERNMPKSLQGLLQIDSINVEMVPVQQGHMYWFTDVDLQHWPVITCNAEFTDLQGRKINFSRTVSCIID